MSDPSETIHPSLLPDAIRDERGEAFRKVLGQQLSTIDVNAHLLTDPYRINAKLLPFLVIERSLDEYIFPGIREDHLRRLIDFAPEIHATKGTVAGVRKALSAFDLDMTWVQWFEETPKAYHDTHKVSVFFNDTLIEGNALGGLEQRNAVTRIITAVKRLSQSVTVTFGVTAKTTRYTGIMAAQKSRHVAGLPGDDPVNHPSNRFAAPVPLFSGTHTAGLEN